MDGKSGGGGGGCMQVGMCVGGSYSKCSMHHAYLIMVVNFPSHLIVHLSDFQVH